MAANIMFAHFGRRRKDRVFRDRGNPLEQMSDEKVRSRYRFSKENVRYICDLIRRDLQPKTARSKSLSVELQVLIALRFYATGSFLQVVGDTLGIEISTASRVVRRVSLALVNLLHLFATWPTTSEKCEMRREVFSMGGFPGVIGCIDGTNVRIQGPSKDEAAFVNRKGNHSINVQAVCDHRGRFTNVVARWPGSTHDSHILKMSQLGQRLQRQHTTLQEGILLGDSGYACRPYLITPYLRPSTAEQERFNSAHKRTRVTIERIFGWLKRRFHVLHDEIRMHPERVCTILGACAVLHNIAIEHREPMDDGDDEADGDLVGNFTGREDGRNVRDYITRNYFHA